MSALHTTHLSQSTEQCIVNNTQYTLFTTHSILTVLFDNWNTTHFTFYTENCKLHTLLYIQHITHYTLLPEHCTLQSAHWTLSHNVHYPIDNAYCTLHSTHCMLHTAHYTLSFANSILKSTQPSEHCTPCTARKLSWTPWRLSVESSVRLKIYRVEHNFWKVFWFTFCHTLPSNKTHTIAT